MGQPLDNLSLQRIVPGIPQWRTEERRHAIPLRVRPQGLDQRLIRRESRIHAVRILQIRKAGKHGSRVNWQCQKISVSRIGDVEPPSPLQTFRSQRVVVLAGQQRRSPPNPTVSNVSAFYHQVRRDFTLQTKAPVNLPRRPARVAVNRNEGRLGRPYPRSDFRGIVRAEIRPEYRRISEPVAGSVWVSVG